MSTPPFLVTTVLAADPGAGGALPAGLRFFPVLNKAKDSTSVLQRENASLGILTPEYFLLPDMGLWPFQSCVRVPAPSKPRGQPVCAGPFPPEPAQDGALGVSILTAAELLFSCTGGSQLRGRL